jgi:predicted sulfurtransferase
MRTNSGMQIVHDCDGYICGRVDSEVCSDCGTSLCANHAEACEFCLKVYCDCCMYFHLKESYVRKPAAAPVLTARRIA